MERLGFLGPQGTHSEAAALYLNDLCAKPYSLQAFADIYTAMQAVEAGDVALQIAPERA